MKRGPKPGQTPEMAKRSERFAELYVSGMTLQQIGDKFGVTRERVRQVLRARTNVLATDGGAHLRAKLRKENRLSRMNARCIALTGYTWEERREVPLVARTAYLQQKKNAERRNIEWRFNLKTWWEFWQESGKWDQRGRGQHFMMCRMGDVGPYEIGNVFIATGCENSSDWHKNKKAREAAAPENAGAAR